jgi:L-threonylcarbamoyladenylate synthase
VKTGRQSPADLQSSEIPRASKGSKDLKVSSWYFGDAPQLLHELLDRGGVLAIPTFAGYGLAADPLNRQGVDRVFQIKHRDADKPLPVVAGTVQELEGLGADFSDAAVRRVAAVWPAPLTMIVPLSHAIPASVGRRDLGVRIPDHPRLAELLRILERPLTATSANRSGEQPCRNPRELRHLLAGQEATIVNVGGLPPSEPSTIVKVDSGSGVTVLRQGRYPERSLLEALNSVKNGPAFSAVSVEISADDSR